jgi:hypothetical protein
MWQGSPGSVHPPPRPAHRTLSSLPRFARSIGFCACRKGTMPAQWGSVPVSARWRPWRGRPTCGHTFLNHGPWYRTLGSLRSRGTEPSRLANELPAAAQNSCHLAPYRKQHWVLYQRGRTPRSHMHRTCRTLPPPSGLSGSVPLASHGDPARVAPPTAAVVDTPYSCCSRNRSTRALYSSLHSTWALCVAPLKSSHSQLEMRSTTCLAM